MSIKTKVGIGAAVVVVLVAVFAGNTGLFQGNLGQQFGQEPSPQLVCAPITNSGPQGLRMKDDFLVFNNDENQIYAIGENTDTVYIWNGTEWIAVTDKGVNTQLHVSQDGTVYAMGAASGRIFKSNKVGRGWKTITPAGKLIDDFQMMNDNENDIYGIGTSKRVFHWNTNSKWYVKTSDKTPVQDAIVVVPEQDPAYRTLYVLRDNDVWKTRISVGTPLSNSQWDRVTEGNNIKGDFHVAADGSTVYSLDLSGSIVRWQNGGWEALNGEGLFTSALQVVSDDLIYALGRTDGQVYKCEPPTGKLFAASVFDRVYDYPFYPNVPDQYVLTVNLSADNTENLRLTDVIAHSIDAGSNIESLRLTADAAGNITELGTALIQGDGGVEFSIQAQNYVVPAGTNVVLNLIATPSAPVNMTEGTVFYFELDKVRGFGERTSTVTETTNPVRGNNFKVYVELSAERCQEVKNLQRQGAFSEEGTRSLEPSACERMYPEMWYASSSPVPTPPLPVMTEEECGMVKTWFDNGDIDDNQRVVRACRLQYPEIWPTLPTPTNTPEHDCYNIGGTWQWDTQTCTSPTGPTPPSTITCLDGTQVPAEQGCPLSLPPTPGPTPVDQVECQRQGGNWDNQAQVCYFPGGQTQPAQGGEPTDAIQQCIQTGGDWNPQTQVCIHPTSPAEPTPEQPAPEQPTPEPAQ